MIVYSVNYTRCTLYTVYTVYSPNSLPVVYYNLQSTLHSLAQCTRSTVFVHLYSCIIFTVKRFYGVHCSIALCAPVCFIHCTLYLQRSILQLTIA